MAAAFESPIAQAPLRELCRGKSRPPVIVDDPNRPTPASRVLPFLLGQLQSAGIPAHAVRILVATGTHGAPSREAVLQKVGAGIAAECTVLVHDASDQVVEVGRTSFGTPVTVNKEVLASDFVVGSGGVYPNQTAGFGGGSKIALAVLGFRSIRHPHYRNDGAGWGACKADHEFRRDVDEIARMVQLRTTVSVHIDAEREIIRLTCGDPFSCFQEEMEFARRTFRVEPPGDADVVICNAFPSDISLTSALMKGIAPLHHCAPGVALNPIRLYRPVDHPTDIPIVPPGLELMDSWEDVLKIVSSEHPGKQGLRAVLYPCSPLQVLD